MQITENDTAAIDIFPLRLAPSLRKQAEELSQKDGVDLNEFINRAVEHAMAQVQHDKWVAARRKPTPEYMAAALAIFDRDNGNEPDPGDELPEGYVSIRFSPEYRKSAAGE
jgi:hypothetical protein